jgi:hypothetical protein
MGLKHKTFNKYGPEREKFQNVFDLLEATVLLALGHRAQPRR